MFVEGKTNAEGAYFSPDRHYVAYLSQESGQREIYIRPALGARRPGHCLGGRRRGARVEQKRRGLLRSLPGGADVRGVGRHHTGTQGRKHQEALAVGSDVVLRTR